MKIFKSFIANHRKIRKYFFVNVGFCVITFQKHQRLFEMLSSLGSNIKVKHIYILIIYGVIKLCSPVQLMILYLLESLTPKIESRQS